MDQHAGSGQIGHHEAHSHLQKRTLMRVGETSAHRHARMDTRASARIASAESAAAWKRRSCQTIREPPIVPVGPGGKGRSLHKRTGRCDHRRRGLHPIASEDASCVVEQSRAIRFANRCQRANPAVNRAGSKVFAEADQRCAASACDATAQLLRPFGRAAGSLSTERFRSSSATA